MTTLELVQYYRNLLIFQYADLPKAIATIEAEVSPILLPQTSTQSIVFSSVPGSGSFTLSYLGNSTGSLAYNIDAPTLQTDLRLLTGLSSVTVSGSVADGFIVTFVGVIPPADLLVVATNTLSVTITISETDVTLPIAVQDSFNLIGDNIATGVQLDILGKYAGVTRNSYNPNGPITLDDSDFYKLIQMAIGLNTMQNSLGNIQAFIATYFPGLLSIFDYTTMRISYAINSSIGNLDLIYAMLHEGLLPRPMAVGMSVFVLPVVTNIFSFRTYALANPSAHGFNTYAQYDMNCHWLVYSDEISF